PHSVPDLRNGTNHQSEPPVWLMFNGLWFDPSIAVLPLFPYVPTYAVDAPEESAPRIHAALFAPSEATSEVSTPFSSKPHILDIPLPPEARISAREFPLVSDPISSTLRVEEPCPPTVTRCSAAILPEASLAKDSI